MRIQLDISENDAKMVLEAIKARKRHLPLSVILETFVSIAEQFADKLNDGDADWLRLEICEPLKEIEGSKKVAIWKTKDGKEIPINEMEDSHLLNAMRALKTAAIKQVVLKNKWKTTEQFLAITPYRYLEREAQLRGLLKTGE